MDDRGTSLENSGLGGGSGLHTHCFDRTIVRELIVGLFRCVSGRGCSQLLQPYFGGVLRYGHVFDYRSRLRFLFFVGRIKKGISGLSRCCRSHSLSEQVFLRLDSGNYLRHVPGLHFLPSWGFSPRSWGFLSRGIVSRLKYFGFETRI